MIDLKNYPVYMGNRLLFQIDNWQLEQSNVYYLLGKNGCGKSTFLRALMENKNASYSLDGQLHTKWNAKELARKMAYVSSKLVTSNYTTVEEFLLMGRYPYGKLVTGLLAERTKEDKNQIEKAIQLLGLSTLRTKYLSELSDGQQQIVSIGRAIVQDVMYVLLDEPTAFLDYKNKRWIFNLVHQLAKEKNICFLVVTHDIAYPFEKSKELFYVDSEEKRLKSVQVSNYENVDALSEVVY